MRKHKEGGALLLLVHLKDTVSSNRSYATGKSVGGAHPGGR